MVSDHPLLVPQVLVKALGKEVLQLSSPPLDVHHLLCGFVGDVMGHVQTRPVELIRDEPILFDVLVDVIKQLLCVEAGLGYFLDGINERFSGSVIHSSSPHESDTLDHV